MDARTAAFWAGALVPLIPGRRRLGKAAAPAVERFSRIAPAAVGVLILAGLVIAILQVGGFGALTATTHGLILVAKLALVAVLIGLALINKIRLSPALRRGAPAVSLVVV